MLLEIDDEVFDNILANWMMKEYEYYYSVSKLPHFDPDMNDDDKYTYDCLVGLKLIMRTYLTYNDYCTFFEGYEDAP